MFLEGKAQVVNIKKGQLMRVLVEALWIRQQQMGCFASSTGDKWGGLSGLFYESLSCPTREGKKQDTGIPKAEGRPPRHPHYSKSKELCKIR